MKKSMSVERDPRVKTKNLGWNHGMITYGIMLLLVGFQTGIVVFPGFLDMDTIFQVGSIMLYWAIVAAVFVYITDKQMKDGYERPMRILSKATKQVADGDFSIYIDPIHTADKHNYIDVMFLDFNKMVAELGSIEALKNDFVSNVSHELKTPLAIIKNYTTMLRKGNVSPVEQQEYISAINDATDRLSVLVTNVLRLSKLDHQAIDSTVEPFDLCLQLSECLLQFETVWEKKNLEIEIEIEDRAFITADASMLEIVWNNLLSNAIKFTDYGGKVAIRQTSDTNSITVSVSDSGCGMNNETIKHIFDKFYQGDTSHSEEGNGLGLALTQRIIEKAGGTIVVESKVGTGSIFTVTLNTQNSEG